MSSLDERRFERWTDELSDEALVLFDQLAELHLLTPRTETREFVWATSQTLGGGGHSSLAFMGRTHRGQIEHAQADVQELVDARLLRRGSGRNSYRLDSTAIRFHEWRTRNVAPELVRHVDRAGVLAIESAGELSRKHPTVARHLQGARDRLGADDLDDSTVIAFGAALRAALAGMAADLAGYDGDDPEKAAVTLQPWLEQAEADGRLPPRQASALTQLVKLTASCCQRLDHVRNERHAGRPEASWEEMRRTMFLTVTCCYELSRIPVR